MMHLFAVVAAMIAATWESWRWYANRLSVSPEEGVSLLFTLAFLVLLALPRIIQRASWPAPPYAALAALMIAYAAAVFWMHPIFAAAVAVTAILFALYRVLLNDHPPLAFWVLVALSLPVLPSLQFVLGYPMRLVSAILTIGLLDLQGLPVARQGTFVIVRGEMVQFDAPCSGVSMLWALMLVALMLATLFRFDSVRLILAVVLTLAVAILCNVLRVSSLLYAELANRAPAGSFEHEAIGLVAFVFSAAAIMWSVQRLNDLRGRAW
jgi:exosortase/archaeosortase family protein